MKKLLMLLVACGPKPMSAEKMGELVCAKAAYCELIDTSQILMCRRCVDVFFDKNGGSGQFDGVISQTLNGTCEDLKKLGEQAGVLSCSTKGE